MPKSKPTTYKQPSIVSGKSVKDILDMDVAQFNSLTTKDMQKVVGRLVSAGNKRARRLLNNGESALPLTRLMSSGGMLSTKDKNLNELRAEFMRAKNFLEDSRSTVTGNRKFKKTVIDQLKKKHNINMTVSQFDQFFEIYEKAKELNPTIANRRLKYGVFGLIAEEYQQKGDLLDGPDVDKIIERLTKQVNEIYEKQEAQEENEFSGVSEFFEI